MDTLSINDQLIVQLKKLQEKYGSLGQDLSSYLDGLLYADYLTYWDYIHLDTLLSLQTPRTAFADEHIFVTYHQITELYFKLIRHELKQTVNKPSPDEAFLKDKLNRIIRYFEQLVSSFSIMIEGMSPDQFLAFRMALLPSSGFQSFQYREIEFYSTRLENLLSADLRSKIDDSPIEDLFPHLYWRSGATELHSGKKTLTLEQFERKYLNDFLTLAKELKGRTLSDVLQPFVDNPEIRELMRKYDRLANIDWSLAHFKSAARYLQRDPDVIKATGGTNWQKYLPPRRQMVQFFPRVWSEEETKNWGK